MEIELFRFERFRLISFERQLIKSPVADIKSPAEVKVCVIYHSDASVLKFACLSLQGGKLSLDKVSTHNTKIIGK